MATRPRAAARAAAASQARPGLPLSRFLPSVRSLAAGTAIVLAAAAAYAAALTTPLFAVRMIDVRGGTPRLQDEVRHALTPLLGRSLVRVDGGRLAARTAAIPDLLALRYDRAFPHTLRVTVKAERSVLLLRQGKDSWLVSSRARVMRRIFHPERSSLPRVWLPKTVVIRPGEILAAADGGLAAPAVSPLVPVHFPVHLRVVHATEAELTLVALSGFELRLGDVGDLRLKLAVARRIVRLLGDATTYAGYLDVSVPQRPVYGR